uniref:Uncharacterized protein n=1 Tax=Arundo donax TaxID=35708 RepID=A0A0A8ZZ06_ARUDO
MVSAHYSWWLRKRQPWMDQLDSTIQQRNPLLTERNLLILT